MSFSRQLRRHADDFVECPQLYGHEPGYECSVCGGSGEISVYAEQLYRLGYRFLAHKHRKTLSGHVPRKRYTGWHGERGPYDALLDEVNATTRRVLWPEVLDSVFGDTSPLLNYLRSK